MSSFQGVGIEWFHCIQGCPHFRVLELEEFHCLLRSFNCNVTVIISQKKKKKKEKKKKRRVHKVAIYQVFARLAGGVPNSVDGTPARNMEN